VGYGSGEGEENILKGRRMKEYHSKELKEYIKEKGVKGTTEKYCGLKRTDPGSGNCGRRESTETGPAKRGRKIKCTKRQLPGGA